jgi:hypothetical protein
MSLCNLRQSATPTHSPWLPLAHWQSNPLDAATFCPPDTTVPLDS